MSQQYAPPPPPPPQQQQPSPPLQQQQSYPQPTGRARGPSILGQQIPAILQNDAATYLYAHGQGSPQPASQSPLQPPYPTDLVPLSRSLNSNEGYMRPPDYQRQHSGPSSGPRSPRRSNDFRPSPQRQRSSSYFSPERRRHDSYEKEPGPENTNYRRHSYDANDAERDRHHHHHHHHRDKDLKRPTLGDTMYGMFDVIKTYFDPSTPRE